MHLEQIITGILGVCVLVFLTYALINPEKF